MDSMDVVQSVHRSLLVGLRRDRYQISSPQQLIGLAAVMVQRKIARQWRKIKRLPISAAPDSADGSTACDVIESDEPAPPESALADDLLERFLQQLDELDRQLVHLKLAGHSSVETAEVLGRDPAFIRMRWSRLRKLLRDRGFTDD
jgi:RNA polymerase sigma-70 factor (ECF subfamily)